MLAFSIDYYGIFFRATQSVELFCTYLPQGLIQSIPFYVSSVHRTILHLIYIGMSLQNHQHKPPDLHNLCTKLATTSSTGGLLLALQRAIVTARPKGRYRKHFCWPAIKRYYSNLLVSILLLALLYTFELLHLLYCQSFQHNIL